MREYDLDARLRERGLFSSLWHNMTEQGRTYWKAGALVAAIGLAALGINACQATKGRYALPARLDLSGLEKPIAYVPDYPAGVKKDDEGNITFRTYQIVKHNQPMNVTLTAILDAEAFKAYHGRKPEDKATPLPTRVVQAYTQASDTDMLQLSDDTLLVKVREHGQEHWYPLALAAVAMKKDETHPDGIKLTAPEVHKLYAQAVVTPTPKPSYGGGPGPKRRKRGF